MNEIQFEFNIVKAMHPNALKGFLTAIYDPNCTAQNLEKTNQSTPFDLVDIPNFDTNDNLEKLHLKIIQIVFYRLKILVQKKVCFDKVDYHLALDMFQNILQKFQYYQYPDNPIK